MQTVNLTYINSVMNEINGLTDDIYEALVDNENQEVELLVEILIKKLRDVKSDALDR